VLLICKCSDHVSELCHPPVEYLLRSPVLPVVDVEAQGAGDGEGQVGDDGEHVHPLRPWYVLLMCSVESLRNLP